MDGVNSMTGNAPDLPAFAEVARRHGALLYVDDAHGFGVIGERAGDEPSPYGLRGNSVDPPCRRELRRHRARRRLLEGVLLAAGVHRVPDRGQAAAQGRGAAVPVLRARRRSRRWPPCSPASTSTSAAATCCALTCMRSPLAYSTPSTGSTSRRRTVRGCRSSRSRFATIARIDAVGRFLFERGVYVTLAAYPLVPRDEVGFRVQLTAANTVDEVDRLIAALEELVDRGELRSARAAAEALERRMSTRRARRARPVRGARTSRSGRSLCAAYVCRAAAEGQRTGDEPGRALAGGRDPRRSPPLPARRPACRGCCWPPARRCSGSATSTRTATRTCSGREVPFPSPGDGLYVADVPGDDGRAAAARPAAQRAAATAAG